MRRRPLPPGSTLRVVATSSPVFEPEQIFVATEHLRARGYEVELDERVTARHGYLAGPARERASALMQAFADPAVDGVLQLRGGYGSAQMLDLLDWDLLRRTAKPFIGTSDGAPLHLALARRAEVVTYWGPTLMSLYDATDYTWAGLLAALAQTGPLTVAAAPGMPPASAIHGGCAEGRLVGGTTTHVAALLGTPYSPCYDGCILLLEDADEEPWVIDRLLTHLRLAGVLGRVAGVVVSEHARIEPNPHASMFGDETLSLEEILMSHLGHLGIPVLFGISAGHGRHHATLALGERALLDADAGTLTIG